jgi:hypothetical protein
MGEQRRAKKFLLGGAIVGGIISLSISLLMDILLADSLQGTWRDAIAKDLNSLFSLGVTSRSMSVALVFVFILAILSAFGAFLGYIFSFFLYKFFELLSRQ